MFSKILVANRGEIACRVMRTAHALGIRTVAVYSDADANAQHVQMADEAIWLGASAPSESYLNAHKVIQAVLRSGAEAVHPGYGFLSENAAFAELCAEHQVVFIGPPVHAIQVMGSKSAAKQALHSAQVPMLPGYHEADQSLQRLQEAADSLGYPVLLKAVAGGGGKGMRQVHSSDAFAAALEAARREAKSSFGNDDMLVEKFLQQPRHVEIQVFCDAQGNGVYLFERDCSVQRRHQKVIEEAPAPGVSQDLRARMGHAALQAAQAVNYLGAGTVEFLLDEHDNFYFMEMNTRLQVEHPVTEMITGQDLVEWQLRVAAGQPLPLTQQQLTITGHSFEARIYAENPRNDFLPTAGQVTWMQQPPATAHVRVDSAVATGDEVGVFYDPMIAKLIVWGEDRSVALQRLARALGDYRIAGLATNIDFLRGIARHAAFRDAQLSTQFIDRHIASLLPNSDVELPRLVVLVALYEVLNNRQLAAARADSSPWDAVDQWRLNGPQRWSLDLVVDAKKYVVAVSCLPDGDFCITVDEQDYRVGGELMGTELAAVVDGHRTKAAIAVDGDSVTVFAARQSAQMQRVVADLGVEQTFDDGNHYRAPMNGTVIDVLVSAGAAVAAGDTLVIMEAMKMEHAVKALVDGTVTDVFVAKGELVDGGTDLIGFVAADTGAAAET